MRESTTRPVPRPARAAAIVIILATTVIGSLAGPVSAGTMSREPANQEGGAGRFIAVGDSILLGARSQLESRLDFVGWPSVLDLEVSRSTIAGAEALSSHDPGSADVVLVSLGANDSGNPGLFRTRAERVATAASAAAKVLWLTVAEVRPYYPGTNDIIRELAARHPNIVVVDWAAVAGRDPSLTAGDGLHLTPRGTVAMADEIFDVLLGRYEAVARTAPAPAPLTEPPSSGSALTVGPPDSVDGVDAVPSTATPATTGSTVAQSSGNASAVPAVDVSDGNVDDPVPLSVATAPRRSGYTAWMIVAFFVIGASMAVPAVWRSGRRAMLTEPPTDVSEGDDGHKDANID